MNPREENILRNSIRHLIREVKQKRLSDENKLRKIIREFMDIESVAKLNEKQTPDVDPTPNKSTGINVLEDLLKKIIPVLETDYKSLTTSTDQRESFRAHIVNAVENSLTPAKVNNQAGEGEAQLDEDLEEEIEINVGDAAQDDEKFIDIRTDAEKAADEEDEEVDPKDDFGDGVGGDETGRNMAYQSFKKIESSVIDAYELLANPEDQELFFDYLTANLKLYFKKFEEELAPSVEEPTNQAYDMAVSQQDAGMEAGGEEDLELEL
tara:strand:+ start:154 stop:951 length:798 start_codon:yes stop_codon:yes gene_type:complete